MSAHRASADAWSSSIPGAEMSPSETPPSCGERHFGGLPRSGASPGVGCWFGTELRIVVALLVSGRLVRLFAWQIEFSPVVIAAAVVVSGMNVGDSQASGQLPG